MAHRHIPIVIDGRRANNEPADICGHFLPAVVLKDLALSNFVRDLWILAGVWSALHKVGRDLEIRMCDARWSDLERLAHELVLRIDLRMQRET